MKVSTKFSILAGVLAVSVGVGLGVRASAQDDTVTPNPGAAAAAALRVDGARLVVDSDSTQACLVTRLGRGSGSSCTLLSASEVMVSYSAGNGGVALAVFDPTQKAVRVLADGVPLKAATDAASGFQYFSIVADSAPNNLSVVDGRGQETARFSPSEDLATGRAGDKNASSD